MQSLTLSTAVALAIAILALSGCDTDPTAPMPLEPTAVEAQFTNDVLAEKVVEEEIVETNEVCIPRHAWEKMPREKQRRFVAEIPGPCPVD